MLSKDQVKEIIQAAIKGPQPDGVSVAVVRATEAFLTAKIEAPTISAAMIAVLENTSEQIVARWCRDGRISGARKLNGRWFAPENYVLTPGTRGPKVGGLK